MLACLRVVKICSLLIERKGFFCIGDFVRKRRGCFPAQVADMPKYAQEWGCTGGLVVAATHEWLAVLVNARQKRFILGKGNRKELLSFTQAEAILACHPAWKADKIVVAHPDQLVIHDVVVNETFPMMQLPPPALSLVLHHLGIAGGAWASLTCKRFLAAFRDEVIWHARVQAEVGVLMTKEVSWWNTFHRHAHWTIHVAILLNMYGFLLRKRFSIEISPHASVDRLIQRLNYAKENVASRRVLFMSRAYTFFNPKNLIVNIDGDELLAAMNGPNCTFNLPIQDLTQISVAQSGLIDGAVLQIEET